MARFAVQAVSCFAGASRAWVLDRNYHQDFVALLERNLFFPGIFSGAVIPSEAIWREYYPRTIEILIR